MNPWHDERYIEVDAAPETVYRYLADFTSQLDWAGGVIDVERPATGFVVGAQLTSAGATLRDHRRIRITALQSPMRIAWDAEGPNGLEEWEFLLLPAPNGRTTLAVRVTLPRSGTIRWLVRGRRRAARLAEENRACLDRIRVAVEASVRLEA